MEFEKKNLVKFQGNEKSQKSAIWETRLFAPIEG